MERTVEVQYTLKSLLKIKHQPPEMKTMNLKEGQNDRRGLLMHAYRISKRIKRLIVRVTLKLYQEKLLNSTIKMQFNNVIRKY